MTPDRSPRPHVLILVHAVRTADEREVHELLLGRLRDRGARLTTIAWDRGMAFLDLEAAGPVHEIEAINRWRLPQALARVGLRPLARLLRQRRVRSWWGRGAPPAAVLVLGRVREEMVHYVPPGSGPVTAVLGWRDGEGVESLSATVELADQVVAGDEAVAAAVQAEDPDLPVSTLQDLVADRVRPACRPIGPGEPVLVVGVGPGDWRAAPELFLRAIAALGPEVDGRPVHAAWLGVDPDDGRSFPYRFDADHLGVDERVRWVFDRADALAALGASSAVVLTGRAPFPFPVHALVDAVGPAAYLSALGPPVLAFDTPVADVVAGAHPALVAYPDVPALAAALRAQLTQPVRTDPEALLDALSTHVWPGVP